MSIANEMECIYLFEIHSTAAYAFARYDKHTESQVSRYDKHTESQVARYDKRTESQVARYDKRTASKA